MSRDFPESASAQRLLAQTNPYAKEALFRKAYSGTPQFVSNCCCDFTGPG